MRLDVDELCGKIVKELTTLNLLTVRIRRRLWVPPNCFRVVSAKNTFTKPRYVQASHWVRAMRVKLTQWRADSYLSTHLSD